MSSSNCSLELIQIASPCPASWDEMTGDERVRFCKLCKLNVYNLSEMSRDEAVEFVGQHTAGQASSGTRRACVRLFRRDDGTVLTKDCPVGLRAIRQRCVRALAALAGLVFAMLGGTLFGGALGRLAPSGLKRPAEALAEWIDPSLRRQQVLGALCPPATPVPVPLPSDIWTLEPAETPLPPPTSEQIQEIQRRLNP